MFICAVFARNMSELSQRQALMVLNAISGTGPVRTARLLEKFNNNAPAILEAPIPTLTEVKDIGPECAATIVSWRNHFDLAQEEDRLAHLGAQFVLRGEPGYPERLARTPGTPHGLYVRGCIPAIPSVAIVGTRRPTLYGRAQARRIAADLARAGICVVSGLARGIDSESHRGALETGRTVAFLGCGVDVVYPPENKDLYERICAEGAVVSEFSLGRQPDAQTFPQRNRLISGMADAVLVVESDLRGGSMITARFAGEQGRLVFALPGRVDQASSRGCHALIRDGATLVTCADDIIEEVRCQSLNFRETPAPACSESYDGTIGGKSPKDAVGSGASSYRNLPDLSEDERRILGTLSDGAVLHPEAIAQTCVMNLPAVMAALMMLELKRLVARRPDATYEAQQGRMHP